jgi:hypothetical protein
MASPVRSDELALDRDLHRIANHSDARFLTLEPVAHPIPGAGETDCSGVVDAAQNLDAHGGRCCSGGLRSTLEPSVVVIEMALGVSGDEHAVVGDMEQAVGVLYLDCTTA